MKYIARKIKIQLEQSIKNMLTVPLFKIYLVINLKNICLSHILKSEICTFNRIKYVWCQKISCQMLVKTLCVDIFHGKLCRERRAKVID